MLGIEELEEILDVIREKVMIANRSGELEELLERIGIESFCKNSTYETEKDGKIVVIGQSSVKENVLLGVAKSFGIEKERFELCLDYDKAKTYEYDKLRYNPKYRVVIFGPIPHSSVGKNSSGSVISEMQHREGYPRIETLSSNGELKITKENFKKILEKLRSEKYII